MTFELSVLNETLSHLLTGPNVRRAMVVAAKRWLIRPH
jgi:hypothetical protein